MPPPPAIALATNGRRSLAARRASGLAIERKSTTSQPPRWPTHPEVAIDERLADMPLEPGTHLKLKGVTHYIAQDSDATLPVVVFRTDDGFLLADG